MTLDEYMMGRAPNGPWRRRAFSVITAVVQRLATETSNVLENREDLLARVDAAYPFGERKYAPYKAWLAERRRFREAIEHHACPSSDELAACEVARDAVEDQLGDALVKALLEQAPNRLARECMACGARPGRPCFELRPADASQSHQRRTLLVPHQARLVGHIGSGPLFGDQP